MSQNSNNGIPNGFGQMNTSQNGNQGIVNGNFNTI